MAKRYINSSELLYVSDKMALVVSFAMSLRKNVLWSVFICKIVEKKLRLSRRFAYAISKK